MSSGVPPWRARRVPRRSRTVGAGAMCCPRSGVAVAWPDPSLCPQQGPGSAQVHSWQAQLMETGCETGCGVPSRRRSRPLPGTYRQGELLVLPRPLDERWLRPRSRAAPISREPPSEEGNGPGPSAGTGPRAGSSKTLPSLGPAGPRTPRPEKGGPGAPSLIASPAPATHPVGTQPCSQRAPHGWAKGTGINRHQPSETRRAPPAPRSTASPMAKPHSPGGKHNPTTSPTAWGGKHSPTTNPTARGGGTALHPRSPASPMAHPHTRVPPPAPQPGHCQVLPKNNGATTGVKATPIPAVRGALPPLPVPGAPIPAPIAAPARPRDVPGVPVPPRPDGASYLVRGAARGAAPGGRTAGPRRGRLPAGAGRGGGG